MATSGRRTNAARAAIAADKAELKKLGLREPPKSLSPEARKEWIAIMKSDRDGILTRSTWGILEQYCNHVVWAREFAADLNTFDKKKGTVRERKQLYDMAKQASAAVASYGVRLGIARTSQAGRHNTDPDAFDRGPRGTSRKPWED